MTVGSDRGISILCALSMHLTDEKRCLQTDGGHSSSLAQCSNLHPLYLKLPKKTLSFHRHAKFK